jgi:hypothetical protein
MSLTPLKLGDIELQIPTTASALSPCGPPPGAPVAEKKGSPTTWEVGGYVNASNKPTARDQHLPGMDSRCDSKPSRNAVHFSTMISNLVFESPDQRNVEHVGDTTV